MNRPGDVLVAKAKSLERRARFVNAAGGALGGAVVSLGISCILVILGNLRLVSLPLPLAVPLIPALSFLFGGLAGWLARTTPQKSLILADRKLQLKERLSTAYELLTWKTGNPYGSLVLRDADSNAARLDPRRIIPFRRRSRLIVSAALLAFLIVLSALGFPRPKADPQMISLGKELEELARRLIARSEREVLPETRRLASEIQRLGEQLQNRTTDRQEARRLLSRIAEQAGLQQEELRERQVTPVSPPTPRSTTEDRLTRTGEDGGFREMDSISPDQAQDLALDEAEEGGEAGPTPSPGAADDQAAQDEQSLQEAREALQELAARLDSGIDSEVASPEGEEAAGAGESSPALEAAEQQGVEAASASEDPGEEPGSEGGDRPATSSIPGTTPAADESEETGRISQAADGEPQQLQGTVESGDSISTLIRSLPERVRPTIPEREVLARYQKQAEEAIASVRLPRRLRETVRDYFLRIGITEEEE